MSTELATSEAIVHEPVLSLDELGQQASHEYEQTAINLQDALSHYLRFGEILLTARPLVEPNGWKKWLKTVGVEHYETAAKAMRLAANRDALPDEAFTVWKDRRGNQLSPSINRALRYVRGLPDSYSKGTKVYDDETRAEVVRLHDEEGLDFVEIAAMLGVGKTSVRNWCDPESNLKNNTARTARRRRNRAAHQALKDQQRRAERDDLASDASKDLSRAYALVRKLALALDVANSSSTRQSTDADLRVAIAGCYKCEDAITQAMRSERAAQEVSDE